MAVTPTGRFSGPLGTLRTLLSTLGAVQTWMGVATDAAALAKIYVNQFDEPTGVAGDSAGAWVAAAAAERPLIVVGTDTFTAEADGSSYWPGTGTFTAEFQEIAQNESGVQTSSNAVTTTDAVYHLMNAVGAIMDAYSAGVEAGGSLHAGGWSLKMQAARVRGELLKGGELDLCVMILTLDRRDMI